MAESIGRSFARGTNNFDVLRLAGAWLVLFSHSFALTGQASAEPIALLLNGAADGGRLAVGMFFVVSGFLVARSVAAHRPGDYLRGRFLRLWPALAVVLLFQIFIVGLIFTTLPTGNYLADPATWIALVRGLLFNPRPGLPGVFSGNPFPDAVNGSLWTLRVEGVCYLLLLPAALAGLLCASRLAYVAAFALGVAAVLQASPSAMPFMPSWLWDARLVAIFDCGVHFLMGAVLWVYRETIPRSAVLAAAGLLSLLTVAHTGLAPVVFHVVFAYLVICAGLAPTVGAAFMRRLGDVSYGTYLYAFPVQQALVAWSGGRIGPWALAAAASLPVLLLATLSQRLVEQPALRLKRRLARPIVGRPAPVVRLSRSV